MSAVISADQKYRYRLTRRLGLVGFGRCCFIMLNPSTADATQDDPTIRRCVNFAKREHCCWLEVVNLFAFRSTDPLLLNPMKKANAVGPENNRHIAEACNDSRIIICAWGNMGGMFQRDTEVLNLIYALNGVQPMALKINTRTGQPAHPLYLKAGLPLISLI